MNRFVLGLLICTLLAPTPVTAIAQEARAVPSATPSPSPSPTPIQYNDPGMSFTVPANYVVTQMDPHDPTDFPGPTMVAVFSTPHRERSPRIIAIQMEDFQGDLAKFEPLSESETRQNADSVFIDKRTPTTLPNGMPAYWLEISDNSGEVRLTRYEYIWVDGVRGVTLSIAGRYGDITEDDAKLALSNVRAVAYPVDRGY